MLPDSNIVTRILDSAILHLREATRIYPTHSNAHLLMGNAMYKRNHNPEEVIPVYEKASAYRVGGYYDAYFNLGIVYNEAKAANPAQAQQNLLQAKYNFKKAMQAKPEVPDVKFLLAQVCAKLNEPDSAAYWLAKGNEQRAATAADYYLIGTNFGKIAGNLPVAITYLEKAVEMAPKVELYYEDLGVAYGLSGQFDKAIATAEKLIQINPDYPAAYMNLSVSYKNKGNDELAQQYLQKHNEVLARLNAGSGIKTQ